MMFSFQGGAISKRKLNIDITFLFILSSQLLALALLYIVLPGRVRLTLTAFQPDSVNVYCLVPKLFGENAEYIKNLNILASHFELGTSVDCSSQITVPYKNRILLPAFIKLLSISGIWWSLLVPSVLIYLAIGFLYWILVRDLEIFRGWKSIVVSLPFLSPHCAWFCANIMTEGPAVLSILILLSLVRVLNRNFTNNSYNAFLIVASLSLLTRQVWPLTLVILIGVLSNKKRMKQKSSVAYLVPKASLVGIVYLAADRFTSHLEYSINDEDWKFSVFQSGTLKQAIAGVYKGISSDILSIFHFFDYFFLLHVLLISLFFWRMGNWGKLVFCSFCTWGLATVAIVYLADGSFGQNWRFFVFSSVLFWPIFSVYGMKFMNENQSQPLLEPK